MRVGLLAAISALAAGFQVQPAAFRTNHRAPATIHASATEPEPIEEQQGEAKKASDILTLAERNDGWDDVRSAIKDGIKQREKPYQQIMERYVEPTKRWSKAIYEVGTETLTEATDGKVVPTLKAPTLDKESAIASLNGLLDTIGDAREKKQQQPAAPAKQQPKVDRVLGLEQTSNAVTFFGLPAVAIAAFGGFAIFTSFFEIVYE